MTTAGVTGDASLLFLDADAARVRLWPIPWIADAAVLKLYPDRLQISVTERQAFALWQKDGHVNVIAADGTVLEPYVEDRYLGLPRSSAAAPRGRPRISSPSSTVTPIFGRCCALPSWWPSGAGTCA